MSEINLERNINNLRDCQEEELLAILEAVESKMLVTALFNKIDRLEKREADMLQLFQK